MSFEPHTFVQLIDDHPEVERGVFGHVVEAFGNTYEVEFIDEEGAKLVLVDEQQIVSAEANDKCS